MEDQDKEERKPSRHDRFCGCVHSAASLRLVGQLSYPIFQFRDVLVEIPAFGT